MCLDSAAVYSPLMDGGAGVPLLCANLYALSHPVQNFYDGSLMSVTVGGRPCTNVSLLDAVSMSNFSCVAPPDPGTAGMQLRASVPGSGSGSLLFHYDPPVVRRVSPSTFDAETTAVVTVCGLV